MSAPTPPPAAPTLADDAETYSELRYWLAASTPGPFSVFQNVHADPESCWSVDTRDPRYTDDFNTSPTNDRTAVVSDSFNREADARFFALAREWVPRLLARAAARPAPAGEGETHWHGGITAVDPENPDLQPPDGAPSRDVLAYVGYCATLWAPETRLVGNCRADDIARAVREFLAAAPSPAVAAPPAKLPSPAKVAYSEEAADPSAPPAPPTSWRCPKCLRFQSTAWERCRSEFDTGVPCDGRRAPAPPAAADEPASYDYPTVCPTRPPPPLSPPLGYEDEHR